MIVVIKVLFCPNTYFILIYLHIIEILYFVDSFDENISESDDANTSFGREILQAVCKNQTPQKRVSIAKKISVEFT